MNIEVLTSADLVAQRAADIIARLAIDAVEARGRFVFGVSGGRTPWLMLRELAAKELPWKVIDIAQVDERIAPLDHPDRNLTALRASLSHAPLDSQRIHPMPVDSPDLEAAARDYGMLLQKIAGLPPILDLIHLGLGSDGHTASLVPGDPALEVTDREVALTGPYSGRRRMTLTYPVLNRAQFILWVVTGKEKSAALSCLRSGSPSIPAGRVRREGAMILADEDAAASLPSC